MAILKNTTINDTGFLQLPVGTTAQRPTPTNGKLRFNSNTGKLEFYNAVINAWIGTPEIGIVAAGGLVYDVDTEGTTYRVHVFTTTGNSTFTVTKGGQVEYLIVAGGGGGGGGGGAGGAGGFLAGIITVTSQSYNITVGGGGVGQIGNIAGNNGANSSALGLTAIGGGGGGALSQVPGSGGSGGGGNRAILTGGSGTAGQGNKGGDGALHSTNAWTVGGGGGGAGSNGQNANVRGLNLPGNGGIGLASQISGYSLFYAGGGGGGTQAGTQNGGLGGIGGGGNGGQGPSITSGQATSGTPNTGGGGGSANEGGSQFGLSGSGGSGIVIIRYPLRQENPTINIPKIAGDGLVLDLDFSKPTVYAGSGTVVNDSRLNGITGTLVNGPVFTDRRTHRSSFQFDGIDDQIVIPSFVLLRSGAALSTWIFIDDFTTGKSSNGRLLIRRAGANFFSMLAFYPGGYSFEVDTNSNPHELAGRTSGNVGDAAITAGSWFHFALVFNANAFSGFVNGVPRGSAALTNDFTFDRIGDGTASPSNYPGFFKGKISYFRVYNRALTNQEILDNYNATRWRFGV